MRLHHTLRTLWLLPILVTGCSSTIGSRFTGNSQPASRSIAVVGDRALPASVGEPGGQVVADAEEPEPKLNSRRRISGRVVDEAGDPVAGASVRLADGGVKGGKEIQGTTDRSGAFTLNGLRPGSNYVLIAEADDDRGPILGRVEATTADTGVEIAVSPEGKRSAARPTPRPSKVKPVSRREELEPESELVPDREDSPRVNREDVAPSADEPAMIDPGPPLPTRVGRPQLSPPEPGVGWKNSKNQTASRPSADRDPEAEAASADTPAPPVRRRVPKAPSPPVAPDDESNPLPPAIDPDGAPSARSGASKKVGVKARPKPPESGEIALAPEVSLREQPEAAKVPTTNLPEMAAVVGDSGTMSTLMPDNMPAASDPPPPAEVAEVAKPTPSEPPALPPVGPATVQVAATDPPSPTTSPPGPQTAPQDVPQMNPAPEPVFALNPRAPEPPEKLKEPDDYNLFANLPQPAYPIDKVVVNRSIIVPASAEASPAASEESPKKKWGELAQIEPATPPATTPTSLTEPPTKAKLASSLFRRKKTTVETKDPAVAACAYDAKSRKLVDFRLPDLEGKSVRFQELDADFVLLDFWGTWCGPCLESIPHLIDLQKKYGPGKLKVVGIACEEVPPELRKAKVDEVSRRLGINYPVLLSTMDGKPCPVQQALQIQAMPTMILVDRKGQVLWRNTGADPASESKLDRILAQNMSRGDTVRR